MASPCPADGSVPKVKAPIVSKALWARRAARMAHSRALRQQKREARERASLASRVHAGSLGIMQRNPLRLRVLGVISVLGLLYVCVVDTSPILAFLKDHTRQRANHYTSLLGFSSVDDMVEQSPRILSDGTSPTAAPSCMSEVKRNEENNWFSVTAYEENSDRQKSQQYDRCVTLEESEDVTRASKFFISGDVRLTTLDCASTLNQWKGDVLYQKELCVKDGNAWKDVHVLDVWGEVKKKCTEEACEEMGSVKGEGRNCLSCTRNVPGMAGASEDLWRFSKTACPEICLRPDKMYYLPVYLLGMCYMFIALAIVVDEFFVPALDEFIEVMGISNDVAGATLMAAGGSMPELFTSFLGTFRESAVGFATIVGSAVFNVLFVIGVCAMSSKEPLHLEWWPLARDCSFYMIALFLVVFVFKFNSENKIEFWEALILLLFYCCYCGFMTQNERIVERFNLAKTTKVTPADQESDERAKAARQNFRKSIVNILMQKQSILDKVGTLMVTSIKNLKETFDQLDKEKKGSISVQDMIEFVSEQGIEVDKVELKKELRKLGHQVGDGTNRDEISFEMFKKWYQVSETRIEIEVHEVFKKFDKNDNGLVDVDEMKSLLIELGHNPTDEDMSNAMEDIRNEAKKVDEKEKGDENDQVEPISSMSSNKQDKQEKQDKLDCGVTFEQFNKWYGSTLFWNELHGQHVEEEEGEGFNIDLPDPDASKEVWAWFIISYPISSLLYVSLPDVRRENTSGLTWAIIEFSASLVWIAIFSTALYEWLMVACNTIGIPPTIASLTLLAGGTSIPDLLSSYVVAKQGQGDMAVSSSIGSNIFDVTVGLPLPWLCYSLLNGFDDVEVVAAELGESIIVLMIMLGLVIGTVMAMRWTMTWVMGVCMMLFYVIFLWFNIHLSPVVS